MAHVAERGHPLRLAMTEPHAVRRGHRPAGGGEEHEELCLVRVRVRVGVGVRVSRPPLGLGLGEEHEELCLRVLEKQRHRQAEQQLVHLDRVRA